MKESIFDTAKRLAEILSIDNVDVQIQITTPNTIISLKDLIKNRIEKLNTFTVLLVNSGDTRLQVVKELKSILEIGFKEAKDLTDLAPYGRDGNPGGKTTVIAIGQSEEFAQRAKKTLEECGATIKIEVEQ